MRPAAEIASPEARRRTGSPRNRRFQPPPSATVPVAPGLGHLTSVIAALLVLMALAAHTAAAVTLGRLGARGVRDAEVSTRISYSKPGWERVTVRTHATAVGRVEFTDDLGEVHRLAPRRFEAPVDTTVYISAYTYSPPYRSVSRTFEFTATVKTFRVPVRRADDVTIELYSRADPDDVAGIHSGSIHGTILAVQITAS